MDLSSFLQDDAVQGPSHRKMKLSLSLEPIIAPFEETPRSSTVLLEGGWLYTWPLQVLVAKVTCCLLLSRCSLRSSKKFSSGSSSADQAPQGDQYYESRIESPESRTSCERFRYFVHHTSLQQQEQRITTNIDTFCRSIVDDRYSFNPISIISYHIILPVGHISATFLLIIDALS